VEEPLEVVGLGGLDLVEEEEAVGLEVGDAAGEARELLGIVGARGVAFEAVEDGRGEEGGDLAEALLGLALAVHQQGVVAVGAAAVLGENAALVGAIAGVGGQPLAGAVEDEGVGVEVAVAHGGGAAHEGEQGVVIAPARAQGGPADGGEGARGGPAGGRRDRRVGVVEDGAGEALTGE